MKRRRQQSHESDTVGYKKPPIATQFKPGNREWLKRGKTAKTSEGPLYRKVMGAAVKIKSDGSPTYASRMQVLVDNFVAAAVRGDIGAAELLLQMHARSKEFGDLNPVVLVFPAAFKNI
jgi:hypothetical protein